MRGIEDRNKNGTKESMIKLQERKTAKKGKVGKGTLRRGDRKGQTGEKRRMR